MMDAASKSRLLDEFREYLETRDAAPAEEADAGADLCAVFGELAALRTEVKSEARLFRAALDDIKEVQGWLRDSQGNLSAELDRFRGEFPGLRRAALRPVLLDLLDLHDRLAAGRDALQGYRPVQGWFRRIKSRIEDRRFVESVREGQGMSLRRLEELLARQQVRPMEILGKPVDPHTMKVMEVEAEPRPGQESGTVTAELRKGFLWGDEVLRLAEVRAAK